MKSKETILKKLINENPNENILFEQYKLYAEMANNISERRENSNKFYLGLISGILTLTSIVITLTQEYVYLIILILICSILICLNWYQNIESYKLLNFGKFSVINHMEKELPAKGFSIEWELINLKGYKHLTYIEKNIPLFFLGLCVILLGLIIIQNCGNFFQII